MGRVINCVQCDQPFELTKKHPNKRFCSLACSCRANAIQQRLPPKVCAYCGETFTSLKSKAEYCSLRCAGKANGAKRVPKSPADRFWSRVSKTDGCWIWTGLLSTHGYGIFSIKSRHIIAPRYSWKLHFGDIPGNMHVLHRCDTPACVRPDHLFLGTHQDNMADMVAKGRHHHGENHRSHVLNDEKVREIRASPASLSQLAKMYGVDPSMISRIKSGKAWKHVK